MLDFVPDSALEFERGIPDKKLQGTKVGMVRFCSVLLRLRLIKPQIPHTEFVDC